VSLTFCAGVLLDQQESKALFNECLRLANSHLYGSSSSSASTIWESAWAL